MFLFFLKWEKYQNCVLNPRKISFRGQTHLWFLADTILHHSFSSNVVRSQRAMPAEEHVNRSLPNLLDRFVVKPSTREIFNTPLDIDAICGKGLRKNKKRYQLVIRDADSNPRQVPARIVILAVQKQLKASMAPLRNPYKLLDVTRSRIWLPGRRRHQMRNDENPRNRHRHVFRTVVSRRRTAYRTHWLPYPNNSSEPSNLSIPTGFRWHDVFWTTRRLLTWQKRSRRNSERFRWPLRRNSRGTSTLASIQKRLMRIERNFVSSSGFWSASKSSEVVEDTIRGFIKLSWFIMRCWVHRRILWGPHHHL